MTTQPKRIAIVGSGIAGLSAACLLSKSHQVVVYEAAKSLGMDAHSLDVPLTNKPNETRMARIDVPLRIFVQSYYPELRELYKHFGVESTTVDVCSSYSNLKGDVFFHYRNVIVQKWFSIASLSSFASVLNPNYMMNTLKVLYLIWNCGKHSHQQEIVKNKTFRQYLVEQNYSDEFINNVAIPMAAIVCTCSYDAVANYPAHVLVDYFARSFMRWNGVQRATNGAREVVTKLSKGSTIRCSAPVRSISKVNDQILLKTDDESEMFDTVIFATPAPVVQKIVSAGNFPDSELLLKTLATFKAEPSDTICHRDERLMPKDRSIWRSVNLITVEEGKAPMVTIWVNKAISNFSACDYDVFQTWNPIIKPSPELVISNATLWRPIVTQSTCDALQTLESLQGKNNIWLCGSWTRFGVPLLEQAARSGVETAEHIGPISRPWPRVKRETFSSAYLDSFRLLIKVLWVFAAAIVWVLISIAVQFFN